VVALVEVNPIVELKPESIYRLIIVAGLRSKQLLRGSTPRIEHDVLKRKNTSIALEEVRLGLVKYTIGKPKQRINSKGRHEAG
jgi:DNA-directed RNA polymerase omega subunit